MVNVSKMPKRVKQEKEKWHNCIICWDPVSTTQQSRKRSKSVSTYSKKQILGRIYSFLKLSWESYPSWDLEWEESLSFCGPCTKGLAQLISLQEKLDEIRKELEDGVDGVKRKLQESSPKVSQSEVTSSSEARVRGLRNLLLQGSVGQDQQIFHPVPSTADVLRQNESNVSEEFAVSDTVAHGYAQGFEDPHVSEAFNNLGIVEVQVGYSNVSVPIDDVKRAEEEEDNENEEDNEDEEEDDNENEEEEEYEDSYGMVDDSNDMDYEPATDVFQVEKADRKIKKPEKKKVTRKRLTTRVSKKDCNSERISKKARSNEYFSPLEYTNDGRMYYDGFEISKHPNGYICGACGFSKTGQNSIILRKMKIHIKGVHMDAYNCDTCGKKFLSYDILNQHTKRIHIPETMRLIYCDICGKPLKSLRSNMERHLWTHKNAEEKKEAEASGNVPRELVRERKRDQKKAHQCFKCGKVFKTPYLLKLHMETHLDPDSKTKFKCTYPSCTQSFCSKSSRLVHIKRIHERHRALRHVCLTCGKELFTKKCLEYHIAAKHKSKEELNIVCPICNKHFIRDRTLQTHLKTHAPAEDFKFSCPVCGLKFTKEKTMKRHKKTHKVPRALKVYVDLPAIVERETAQKDMAREGVEVKSRDETSQESQDDAGKKSCSPIDGTSKRKQESFNPFTETEDGKLLYETFEVKKLQKGAYQCASCEAKFTSNSEKIAENEIKRHINGFHLGRYTCPICNRKFPSKLFLGKHKRDIHFKRQKECDVCGATVQASYARHHAWLHMNAEEMAACVNSGIRMPCTFRILKQTMGHEIHPEAKFICIECNEAFHSVFDLEKHCLEQHLEKFNVMHHPRSVKNQSDSKDDTKKIKKPRAHRSIDKRKRGNISSEDSDSDNFNYSSSTSADNDEDVQRKSVNRKNPSKPSVVQKNTKKSGSQFYAIETELGKSKNFKREDIEAYNGTADQEVGNSCRKKPCKLKNDSLKQKYEKLDPFTETQDGELLFESYKVIKLDKGAYKCVSCGSEFKSNYDKIAAKEVKSHINGIHLGRYTCSTCNKKFPSKITLGKHERDVHVKRNKECKICGATVRANGARHHSWLHMNAEEMAACINSGIRMPNSFQLMKQSLGHDIYPEAKFICNECNESFHSVLNLDKHCSEQHLERLKGVYRPRTAKTKSGSKKDTEKIKKPKTDQNIVKPKKEISSSEDSDSDDLDYFSSENDEDEQRNFSVNRRNHYKQSAAQEDSKLPEPLVVLSALPSRLTRSQNVKVISEKLISYVCPKGKAKLMSLDEDMEYSDSEFDSDSDEIVTD